MILNNWQFDIVVLVPGNNEKHAIESLLSRRKSLQIRELKCEIPVHLHRDPGCFNEAQEFLRPYIRLAEYSLVIFDYEGSGQENRSIEDIYEDLKTRLTRSGWANRTEVVVITPELESWVWSDSPEVDIALGWGGQRPQLRQWLTEQGLWTKDEQKPKNPKRAFEEALRHVNMPRSSSIYGILAEKVSFDRCQDKSFIRLKDILKSWFAE